MELMVRNGDYVPDEGGGYRRAEGSQELLQRVLWKLSIPRGSFPFLPNLGSLLYQLGRCKPNQRQNLAQQYVAQALEDEPDLTVTAVSLEENGTMEVVLEWQGEELKLTVVTGGIW